MTQTAFELEIFSDYPCIWCYFALPMVDRIKETFDISIKWRSFPFKPDTPKEGITLEEALKDKPVSIDEAMESIAFEADKAGVLVADSLMSFNSGHAQQLNKLAALNNKEDLFKKAVFHAYYVDVLNIAEIEALFNIASSVKLSVEEAKNVIAENRYRAEIEADYERAKELNIQVLPTYVIGGEKLVGARPFSVIERFLISNGAPKKDPDSREAPAEIGLQPFVVQS